MTRLRFSKLTQAVLACALLILGALLAHAQWAAGKAPPAKAKAPQSAAFAPVEQWKAAVIAGDAAKLRALYSSNPAARVVLASGEAGAETDVAFWIGLKARRMKIEVVQSESPQAGVQQVAFETEIVSGAQSKPQTVYVTDGQLWQQQAGQWRIVATRRNCGRYTAAILQPG